MTFPMPNAAEFIARREVDSAGYVSARRSYLTARRDGISVNNRLNEISPQGVELIEAAR